MKKEYAINTGSTDGKNVTITIVENIQEVNFYDGGGKTILPAMVAKKSNSNQLISFFTLVLVMVLCILGFITYISLGDELWTMGSSQKKNYVAQVAPNAVPLAAQTSVKPILVEQPCYGFTIPYAVQKSSQKSACSILVSLRDPKGTLTVDYRIKESGDLLPDITMRRAFPSKYEESKIVENEVSYIVFKNKEVTGYEKTAFVEKNSSWIALTLKTEVFKDRDEDFKTILRSFYCKNGCALTK